jgi:biopolymer transport protein ExbD
MSHRRCNALLAQMLAMPLLVLAVGCEEDVEPESTEPIVGLMEIPVSLRAGDARPDNPLRIEIAPAELRLDHRKVLDLASGRAAESERREHVLPKLEAAIAGGGSRGAAAIRLHANVPYETLVSVLNTLSRAGVGNVAFEVRKVGGSDVGWMRLGEWRVQAPSDDPIEFPAEAQRSWDEVAKGWQATYDACRQGKYVDCDPTAVEIAEGGKAALTLMSRGQAVKASFDRFGAIADDDEQQKADDDKAPVAMIPGVPVAGGSADEEEEEVKPAEAAVFTWKLSEATKKDSAISLAMRPFCGSKPCGALVRSEYATPAMRPLAFIGAVSPDGAPAPVVVFERPASR